MNPRRRLPTWIEANPERLQWELDQLASHGWSFEVDQPELRLGRVVLVGEVSTSTGPRCLRVVFPDSYPEHRLEVYDMSEGPALPLHQHPYERNLCLIDTLPRAWATDDSAAWMVGRAIALINASAKGVEALEEIGVGAPEPKSYYFPYLQGSAVVVPEQLLGVAGQTGLFRYVTLTRQDALRGVVASCSSKDATESTRAAPAALRKAFRGLEVVGPWFRLPAPPPWHQTAQQFKQWASSEVHEFDSLFRRNAKAASDFDAYKELRAFALVYPDEGPTGLHDAWLVVLEAKERASRKRVGGLLRPFIYSHQDQELRIAALGGLRGKKVAIFGLGTVGAPIAFELGRTGMLGEMLLVDFDHYTIWNLVRHPLDLTAIGLNKAAQVASRLHLFDPMLNVRVISTRVGAPVASGQPVPNQVEAIAGAVEDYDLVIDATADSGSARLLNQLSLALNIPLLVASVTEGAWGGEVVRSIPRETGCYECYLWHLSEGSVPKPSQDEAAPPIFTRGCGLPSFSGAGFDATALAADATRLAAQTLLRSHGRGYPDAPYDILVRDNRAGEKVDGLPQYRTASLTRHPRCSQHTSGA